MFFGIVLAKAIYDRQLMDVPLSATIYKLLLGKPLGLADLEDVDKQLHTSLCWMRDNSVDGTLFETFSVARSSVSRA